jgi:hypothetical protein
MGPETVESEILAGLTEEIRASGFNWLPRAEHIAVVVVRLLDTQVQGLGLSGKG